MWKLNNKKTFSVNEKEIKTNFNFLIITNKMKKTILIILTGMIVISNLAIALAQTEQYNCPGGGMMYGLYGNYGSGFAVLSWITFILFIILIIAAIYWLIKSANKEK